MSSASVNFQAQGVTSNHVVWLNAPKGQYPGGGHFLAVDSASGNSITLRRVHQDLNIGQPPGPATGVTGVNFTINTLGPQIEEATYEVKRQFGIDENIYPRSSNWVYDIREFRIVTILNVLWNRYTQESRTDRGDFEKKVDRIRMELREVIDRIQVRWGPFGSSGEPSTVFSCKLSR
jgi:hypothetical protein